MASNNELGPVFRWSLKRDGIILPNERPPAAQIPLVALQHVVAMFGATVLAPLLMGFNPNTAIFASGVGTLIFFVLTAGRVPSYLGSSFAFIGVVIAATGYSGPGPNPNLALALGGIIAAGALYVLIGIIVKIAGSRWIERLMPPVLTGAVIGAIGLNLAAVAVRGISGSQFDTWIGLLTIVVIAIVAVFTRGLVQRLPILIGGAIAYVAYLVAASSFGIESTVNFDGVSAAPWFGLPEFTTPVFDTQAMFLIAPVAVILVAENLGHVKAIGVMTGHNLDKQIGNAFVGDGVATMVAGSFGGTGVTTYAENMGVMAVTRNYSSLVFAVAAVLALGLGLCPKFGALIQTIPGPVLGGLSIVVFGLIAATAGRIWVENNVSFSDSRNLITAGTALILGAGDLSVKLGEFTLGGIGTATFGAIILYHLLGLRKDDGPAVRT